VGIPVMGHLGLQPQSVHQLGGYGRRGSEPHEAAALVEDAVALEQAGAFAIVLESIPPELAQTVTKRVDVPTIGIGSGADCDGQVLVSYDMLGLFEGPVPSFVKQYANLASTVTIAARAYIDEVRSGSYPTTRSTISSSSKPLGTGTEG
jgi:3-methyl-2-oxobutanoate hydroxymethyltransferase